MKTLILLISLGCYGLAIAGGSITFIVPKQNPNSPSTCVVYVDGSSGAKIPFIVPNPNYPNGDCPK